ncbi:group II truncated hemoglobin [Rhizobium sp. GN54]|uniref:group II truncated hemoglobin n=1 Tax=Rhizobium sp. GN54 TaxID=2898150 RepID=UPI001E540877|nr:group II truncated hemoglobin [Rhizobium sp. GN54]MCD2183293.1 group II truncated hemoglobin [Rhizobium sp. GN54]
MQDRQKQDGQANGTITLYEAVGGEAGVRALTRRFYALMDTLPEAVACRAIHPADLSDSEEKLFEYLSGWLGGPPLYTDKRGHPMLRRRHFAAAIGTAERDGWLLCFTQALEETVPSRQLRDIVLAPVTRLAEHMVNQEQEGDR